MPSTTRRSPGVNLGVRHQRTTVAVVHLSASLLDLALDLRIVVDEAPADPAPTSQGGDEGRSPEQIMASLGSAGHSCPVSPAVLLDDPYSRWTEEAIPLQPRPCRGEPAAQGTHGNEGPNRRPRVRPSETAAEQAPVTTGLL